MTSVLALWLPILLSAVAVFAASSIIHMMSPWHKNDYGKIPDEDAVRSSLGPLTIPPGDYMVPRPESREGMRSPEFLEKMRTGPRLIMTVLPGGDFSMTKNLVQWFLYLILISLFAAGIAGSALPQGAEDRQVFHFVALSAFGGYTLALWQMSVWYGRSWTTTIKSTFDGLIYALITAAIFCWLWP
ncbi:MAG: hypothetical protein M3O61_02395 [Gemmatimonadota bacterium]|nr:hypothetical protein [Gemmatimonadota bacterium]